MTLGIRLGYQREMLARPASRQFKRKTLDTLDSAAGKNGNIHGDFLGEIAVYASTGAGIFALGIFAYDDPVEITGADIGQRRFNAR